MRVTSSADETRATPSDAELEQELPVELVEVATKFDCTHNGSQRKKNKGMDLSDTPKTNGFTDHKDEDKLASKKDSLEEINDEKANSFDKSQNQPKETAFDWLVLFCSFGSNIIFGMDFSAFSVFYPPLVEHFQATTAEVGWCLSIEAFVGTVLSIFSSYPIELYGCRLPGIIGSSIFCFGVAITAFAPSLSVIYFTYGILAGCGASICGMTPSIIIQQRFHRNRGLVSGISVLGFSCGGFIGPSVANFLLQHFNWRGAYLIMSAIYAHRIAFAILFITPPQYLTKPKRQSESNLRGHHNLCRAVVKYIRDAFDFSILKKQKVYVLYIGVICLLITIMTGYMQHSVNRALHTGIPEQQAFWAASLVGLANTVSRAVVSFIGNLSCVNRCLLMAFGLSLSVVSILILLLLPGIVGTMTSSVIFGIMAGCTGTLGMVVTVDLVGVELLTRCLAIQMFITSFFRLASLPFIGWIFDVTQNYNVAFAVIGCCGFVSSLLMGVVYVLQKKRRNKSKSKSPAQQEQQQQQQKQQQQEIPLSALAASTLELSHN